MKFNESETLELKKSTSERKEAVISIAAILNKHGHGELYFGIKNDGTVVGQEVTEKTVRQISQYIADNIEPKIYPEINPIRIKEIDCIHVKFSGIEKPYFASGRAYIRVGDEDRQLSAKEIENIILKKHKNHLRWDNRVCEEAGLQNISPDKLKVFLEKAGLKFTLLENSLTKLGLMRNGNILNSAVMLFAEKPEEFFPNAKLRCAVFGTTRTAYIIDRQEFSGDLFYLIEMAEEYILKNIHIGMKLDGLYRVDVPEISQPAFREAVINAFCHRDYNEYDSVNIAIFKDRVEIRNPGGLFGGLTIEQIKKEPISKRRNELIAEMFHRVRFVEKWGRGIELIRTEEPTVDFKEVADTFIATFSRKNYDITQDVVAIYNEAHEIIKRDDMVAWRKIIRQAKMPISNRLTEWRKNQEKNPPNEMEKWKDVVAKGIAIYAPLFVIALAGVESGKEEFNNQISILDEILYPKDWNRNGLTVIVEFPKTIAFVYQALHGAMCLQTGQLNIAINLARTRVEDQYRNGNFPLYQDKKIIGWLDTFIKDCVSSWKFLLELAEKWSWLGELFGEPDEYRSTVCAYYMALNIFELAEIIASGKEAIVEKMGGTFAFFVPLCFLHESEEIIRKAYRLLLNNPENVKAIWRNLNVKDSRISELWPYWINHTRGWLYNVYNIISEFSYIPHENFFKDLT